MKFMFQTTNQYPGHIPALKGWRPSPGTGVMLWFQGVVPFPEWKKPHGWNGHVWHENLTMTSVPYANICQYMPNFWLARSTLKLTKQHQLADVRNKTRPPPLPTTSWSPPFFNWHSQVSSSCQGAGYVSTSCWFPFPKSSAVALVWDVPEVDLLWPRSPQWEVGLRWPLILTNDVSASTCAMPQTLLGLSGTSYFWWPLQYLWPFTMLRWLNFMALTRLREGRDCWPLGFGWTPFAVFNTFYINKKTTKTQGKTLNEPLKKNLSEP